MKKIDKKELKRKLKDPTFFIAFAITWVLLESPAIVCYILYFVTGADKYFLIATSWVALTAPPLPIPVVPISIAVGVSAVGVKKLIKKKRERRNGKDSDSGRREEPIEH